MRHHHMADKRDSLGETGNGVAGMGVVSNTDKPSKCDDDERLAAVPLRLPQTTSGVGMGVTGIRGVLTGGLPG